MTKSENPAQTLNRQLPDSVVSKLTKFENDMLETKGDRALQSREILQTFVWRKARF